MSLSRSGEQADFAIPARWQMKIALQVDRQPLRAAKLASSVPTSR